VAGRLLTVSPAAVKAVTVRRDACGSRLRLRALVATGHCGTRLARHLGVPSATVWNLLNGRTTGVSAALDASIRRLYDQIWNLRPPERTTAERRAAAAARTRAARNGWPAPMGLDDDLIDKPGYRPRSRWLPATGAAPSRSTIPARSARRHGTRRGHDVAAPGPSHAAVLPRRAAGEEVQ